jgi:hypothetical protein
MEYYSTIKRNELLIHVTTLYLMNKARHKKCHIVWFLHNTYRKGKSKEIEREWRLVSDQRSRNDSGFFLE